MDNSNCTIWSGQVSIGVCVLKSLLNRTRGASATDNSNHMPQRWKLGTWRTARETAPKLYYYYYYGPHATLRRL